MGCRAENPPQARFCNQCGARLAPAREAEHRQITVLFADLVGSTALAARLGPEDWREVVRRFQLACGECVSRYEGTVAQYLGDGVLAYFGHPLAHEDDPERALRAGLDLLARFAELNAELASEYGVQVQARIAAHTGSVVIGEMGGPSRSERLALGEAPNVAARLQELAAPDSLLTSAATHALIAGRFEVEALGPRTLKGVREPVAVYRVLGEASSPGRFRSGTGEALEPFVGRENELAVLRAAFDDAALGRGRLVWIGGEPGMGKSRLLHEFRLGLGDRDLAWLDLHASVYERHHAFEPLRALLAECDGSDARAERERLAELLGVAAASEHTRLLAAPSRRAAAIEALGDWLLALAAVRPVVLAVEDFHALDPSTIEALEHAVAGSGRARLAIVVASRSGTTAPEAWRDLALRIDLAPLSRVELEALISGTASRSPLADHERARVIERCDGNPLFARELLRAAAAGEAGTVPAALRDPLRARLDRTGDAQATAQLASALGLEFSLALASAVSKLDPAALLAELTQLVQAGLLLERGTAAGPSYRFSHALLRDAAYDSMLRRGRQALHADIARALVTSFAPLARARPDLLAHHHAAAAEHAAALHEWLRAVRRSSDACAFRETLAQIDRALESLGELPQEEQRGHEVTLQIYRGNARMRIYGHADPAALQAYQRARELAERIDDPSGACMALLGVQGVVLITGTTGASAEICAELLERARLSGNPALLKLAHLAGGLTEFARGDIERAHAHLAAAVGGYGVIAESYLTRTTFMTGERARALELCAALESQVKEQAADVQSEALNSIGIVHLLARDFERALSYARRSAALSRREGLVTLLGHATSLEGAALAGLGDPAAGIERFETGFEMAGRQGYGYWGPRWARAKLDSGDAAGALALADAALEEEARHERHLCKAELAELRSEARARLDAGAVRGA